MLKQVKTTKICKCANCNREIKSNWDAYYDDVEKKVYCKSCGKSLTVEGEKEKDTVSSSQYNLMLDLLNRQAEQLAVLNDQVNSMNTHIENLINRISRLLETKGTKAKTK